MHVESVEITPNTIAQKVMGSFKYTVTMNNKLYTIQTIFQILVFNCTTNYMERKSFCLHLHILGVLFWDFVNVCEISFVVLK